MQATTTIRAALVALAIAILLAVAIVATTAQHSQTIARSSWSTVALTQNPDRSSWS